MMLLRRSPGFMPEIPGIRIECLGSRACGRASASWFRIRPGVFPRFYPHESRVMGTKPSGSVGHSPRRRVKSSPAVMFDTWVERSAKLPPPEWGFPGNGLVVDPALGLRPGSPSDVLTNKRRNTADQHYLQ